jgi:hypothetical protein
MRLLVAAAAGATLVVGFGVAQATGSRPLGGVVLLAGATACGAWWWRTSGPLRALGAVGVGGVAFVVSHPLGNAVGAWPAVLLVAGVGAVLAYAITAPQPAGAPVG